MMKYIVVCVLALTSVASASIDHDVAPTWRGDANTTYQAWSFDDASSPAVIETGYVDPEDVLDGGLSLEIMGIDPPYVEGVQEDPPNTKWIANDNGHKGVWRVFKDSYLKLNIDNDPVESARKTILLQMTYYASGILGADPDFGFSPEVTSVERLNKTKLDDAYYYHATWEIVIEPSSDNEIIFLRPRDCTIYIDEVIVDTMVVPEPATMCLLAVGGLLIRRKRK